MQVVPLLQLDEETFSSALSVMQRTEVEMDPDTAPITETELRLLATDDRTEGARHERHAVVDGIHARALVHLELEQGDENPHLASAEVFGADRDPEAGRIAVTAALDVAEADNRTSLLGWGHNTPAEADFWTSLGAELKYLERMSTVDMTRVDRALMNQWTARRTERAADVEMVRWIGPCPDDFVDSLAVSRTAMNDAPTDDLDINDWQIDVDDIRREEHARDALGTRVCNLLAIAPDGGPAGHTTVHVNPLRPDASWQWDTVVLEHHRHRGIGRWLKAEMWKWLREAEPEVTRLATGNAESNAAMLAINVAMGFRETAAMGAWQAPSAVFRAALD